MKIGLDIPIADYHNVGTMSASKMILFHNNRREFKAARDGKKNQTSLPMITGGYFHAIALKQSLDDFIVLRNNLTSLRKEELEEIALKLDIEIGVLKPELIKAINLTDKVFIPQKQVELAERLKELVWEKFIKIDKFNEKIKDCLFELKNCYKEKTFYGEIDGVTFQIRPDILIEIGKNNDVWFCVDLKSSRSDDHKSFENSIINWRYDIQQSIYTEILKQNGISLSGFYFVVAGKGEFDGCETYQISPMVIEETKRYVIDLIKKYKYCELNGYRNYIMEEDHEGKWHYPLKHFASPFIKNE